MNLILTIHCSSRGLRRRVIQNGQQITLGPSTGDDFRVSGDNAICIRRVGAECVLEAENAVGLFVNGRQGMSGHLHDGDVIEFEDATITVRFRSTSNPKEQMLLPDRLRSAETTFLGVTDVVEESSFSASSSNWGRGQTS